MNSACCPDYIAIDWGTSRRRAYRIGESGKVARMIEDDRGVQSLDAACYPAALAALREVLGNLPIVAVGMVGSQLGWRSTPYLAAPATLSALAGAAIRLDAHDCILTPGVSWNCPDRCDVMRGEEIQALGAVAGGLIPPTCLVCQPGTHSKWIRLVDGRIETFRSVMTGELFALLKGQGSLASLLDGEVAAGDAFGEGVLAGARTRNLGAALFAARAAVMLGRRSAEKTAAYASGVLIGAEIASELGPTPRTVYILADNLLGGLYAAAAEMLGGAAIRVESHAAFVAGVHALRALL